MAPSPFKALKFDNRAIRELPVEAETRNYVRPAVAHACWSKVAPTPVRDPVLVAASSPALELMGVSEEDLRNCNAAEYFSGNRLFPGTNSHAHCYCGHQFGSFSGQLGDGAAMYLGELLNDKGERYEIQFKGAGPTPYSRRADGRKVLRSSIREFLCSEAMHFLNIPSTRAATLVTSDTLVQRDLFYTGNVIDEKASIVLRLAPTFLRFGSFEIFRGVDAKTGRSGPSTGDTQLLKQMLQYSIRNFFPEAQQLYTDKLSGAGEDAALSQATAVMFEDVVRRTAELVAGWQCVGFTHGVLNTDNMSILGLTIDYGPYGFMEHFDPDYVPNGSDSTGRYRYSDQPEICKWNLGVFAESLAPVLNADAAEAALSMYDTSYSDAYNTRTRAKLSLLTAQSGDESFVTSLFSTMHATAADFSGTFRVLMHFAAGSRDEAAMQQTLGEITNLCASTEVLYKNIERARKIGRPGVPPDQLKALWTAVQADPERIAARFGVPPAALIAELQGEVDKMEAAEKAKARALRLQGITSKEKAAEDEATWKQWLQTYAERLSSEPQDANSRAAARQAASEVNPVYVLRNWSAQQAIADAEEGNYEPVREVLSKVLKPFDESQDGTTGTPEAYAPPVWAADLICTCSS